MRKKLLPVVFMFVLLLPMLGTPSVVSAANHGSTLVMGTTDFVMTTIDPAEAWDFFGWEIILDTGCGLVETKSGTSDIMPSLATNWSVSDDGLNWTFSLRSGVRFDDGTEFNATHVKYSFDRAMTGIACPWSFHVSIGLMDIIKNVTVISKYVVQFNLKILFSPLLSLMACPALFIVNPNYAPFDQIVNYTEGDARASSPMDLGPYILTNWTRVSGKDHEMWLEANPNYWRAGYPKTKKIIIKFYPNATALRQAIETWDIDIAFRNLSSDDIRDLQDVPDLKVWQGTGGFIQYMIFQEAMPPLNDSRVRRAITAALDRPGLCETVFLNQSEPLYSIIPKGMMGHTEAFKTLGDANCTYTQNTLNDPTIYGGPYNATNKLQIELWFESSGHYPASPDQAQLYNEQLEASGVISVTLKSADWPTYRINRYEGTMQVFTMGWYPDYIDPDDYAFLYWASWLNHHYAEYNATNHYNEMVAAYDAARATTNETERIALYAEIDNYAVMDCPVIPLWQGQTWAVTKQNVEGVYLDVTGFLRMWYLYTAAVGGVWVPVNKLDLLAPWIGLTSAIILAIAVTAAFLKYRKKQ